MMRSSLSPSVNGPRTELERYAIPLRGIQNTRRLRDVALVDSPVGEPQEIVFFEASDRHRRQET